MPLLRIAIAGVLAVAPHAGAQVSAQTLGDFLLERQREFMTPSATFCAAELPMQAADFRQANERFRNVAAEATKGLRKRFGAEILAKLVPAAAAAFDPAQALADRGRLQGAEKFCPQVLRTMRSVTVEALREVAENAFAGMEAAAAARSQASGATK